MSRFLATLLESAARSAHGMVTGEPRSPRPAHLGRGPRVGPRDGRGCSARRARGSARARSGAAVGVLAGEPVAIAPLAQAVWLVGGSVTMLHQPTARTDLAVWAEDTGPGAQDDRRRRSSLLGPPFDALAAVLAEHGIPCPPDRRPRRRPATVTPDAGRRGRGRHRAAAAHQRLDRRAEGRPDHPRATCTPTSRRWCRPPRLDAERDVMVSWLPLFHDMGMVGFLTVPMTLGLELVTRHPARLPGPAAAVGRADLASTAARSRPHRTSPTPSSARQLARADDGSLDLSSLRFALNGAEPIDPAAVARVHRRRCAVRAAPGGGRCAPTGWPRPRSAVSFAPVDTGLQVDEIDADELEEHRALPSRPATARRGGSRCSGRRCRGIEVRVVGDDGARARRAGGRGAAAARRVGDAGLPDRRRSGRRRRTPTAGSTPATRATSTDGAGGRLRPAQGRDHHGWPQHLPDRHRARRLPAPTGCARATPSPCGWTAGGGAAPRSRSLVAVESRQAGDAGGGAGDRART